MPVERITSEHEARIAVLENAYENQKEAVSDMKGWLSSIDKKVDDITDRLAKQNGAIPHMQGDIKELTSDLKSVLSKLDHQQASMAENKWKTRVLWSAISGLVGLFVAGAIDFFLKG